MILTRIATISEAKNRHLVYSYTVDSSYCCKQTHSLKVNVCHFVMQDAASSLEGKKRRIGETSSQV